MRAGAEPLRTVMLATYKAWSFCIENRSIGPFRFIYRNNIPSDDQEDRHRETNRQRSATKPTISPYPLDEAQKERQPPTSRGQGEAV